MKLSSAGAAATLANSNQKHIELWKPDDIPEANKAAMLAKDYHMDPLWQPELNSAGAKAALLAHQHGGNVVIWKPEENDIGNSAAGQAMRKKGLSPNVERGVTQDDGRKALLAATMSMSGRKRSESHPVAPSTYPDQANSAANALKAATMSTQKRSPAPTTDGLPSSSIDASRIYNISKANIDRRMYTDHPPVALEVEEKNKQDTLRAAAISMAKQMYNVQQQQIAQAAGTGPSASHYGANSAHARRLSIESSSTVPEDAVPRYTNLQEAAQKLASERLAKLNDENAAYRNYYGAEKAPSKRLSIRGRPRRRASSDGEARDMDEKQSRKIRTEMSLFKDQLSEVDAKKRQNDRKALMAAAQKKVQSQMHTMDEKVLEETGKASPALMKEWEEQARARAAADSEARMVNHGKVHIGGGKYLEQSDVDAVAKSRIQPTLDEISNKAEAQRAREADIRLDQEEKKRQANLEKQRDADTKAAKRTAAGKHYILVNRVYLFLTVLQRIRNERRRRERLPRRPGRKRKSDWLKRRRGSPN